MPTFFLSISSIKQECHRLTQKRLHRAIFKEKHEIIKNSIKIYLLKDHFKVE